MNDNVSKPVRKAEVYYNKIHAGILLLNRGRYTFIYDREYMFSNHPSIALDMPKRNRFFCSPYLFPFFQGLLPEGANRAFLCRCLGISSSDKFTMLVKLANHETIGAITVREEDV